MWKSRRGYLVINNVGRAPLHQILTAPVKWRWEVTARFCYCHWMAIEVKQRSLCKAHTLSQCSTSLLRGMAVVSALPADTTERSRAHRLAAIQPARLFLRSG